MSQAIARRAVRLAVVPEDAGARRPTERRARSLTRAPAEPSHLGRRLVMDGLTKAGVWCDDTRVADLVVQRRYLPLDGTGHELGLERTEVQLWTM